MISRMTKLENRIVSCVTNDLEDPTLIRIDIENVFYILADFDFVIPRRQFENKLINIIENHKPENLTSDYLGKLQTARAIIRLAQAMHVPPEMIKRYEKQAERINKGQEKYQGNSVTDEEVQ